MAERAVLRKGQRIERVKDGRRFRVVLVNTKGINGPVFSAESDDGRWSGWGGPFPFAHEIREPQPADSSVGAEQ